MNSLKLLQEEPSRERWQEEIFRILHGERDPELRRRDNVHGYIELVIEQSLDGASSRSFFIEALNSTVMNWRPGHEPNRRYLELMIDLLNGYTPPVGFTKLVKLFDFKSRLDNGEAAQLRLRGLHALHSYWPAAPVISAKRGGSNTLASAFQTYLQLLRQHLMHSNLSGYAAAELVRLSVLKLDDREIDLVLRKNSHAIRDLLHLLLRGSPASDADIHLGQLYGRCLQMGKKMEAMFRDVTRELGGSVIDNDEGPPTVVWPAGESVVLILDESSLAHYYSLDDLRRNDESEHILKKSMNQFLSETEI